MWLTQPAVKGGTPGIHQQGQGQGCQRHGQQQQGHLRRRLLHRLPPVPQVVQLPVGAGGVLDAVLPRQQLAALLELVKQQVCVAPL